MTRATKGRCSKACWRGSAAAGALLFVILLSTGTGFFSALLVGLVGYGLMGFGLTRVLCGDVTPGASVSASAAAAGTSTAAAPAGMVAPTPQPAPEAPAEAEAGPAAARVTPSAALAGEAELAARKGSWRYEARAGAVETAEPAPAEAAAQPAAETASEPAPAAETTAAEAAPAPAAKASEPRRPLITPSAVLAGEAELSTRKGSWRYQRPAG